jgi:hypothetical protein
MKLSNPKDFLSGVMFTCIGLTFAIGALGYKMGTGAKMGAGYFPFYLGAIMTALGLLIMFKGFRSEGARINDFALRPLILITLGVVVFGLSMKFVGLIAATFLLVTIVSIPAEGTELKDSAFAAIALLLVAPVLTLAYLLLTQAVAGTVDPILATMVASAKTQSDDMGFIVKALLLITKIAIKGAILISAFYFALRAVRRLFPTVRSAEITTLATVMACLCVVLFIDGLVLPIPVTLDVVQNMFLVNNNN